jgi:hypothetical protein
VVQHQGAASPVKRQPGSTRPLLTREAIQGRHDKILRLWNSERPDHCKECGQTILRRRTLKEIALLAGLRNANTVKRHVEGKCRCDG